MIDSSAPLPDLAQSSTGGDAAIVPVMAEMLPVDPRSAKTWKSISPARRLEIRRSEHRLVFWLSLAMLALGLILQIDDDNIVELPFVGVRLPGMCWFKSNLGIDCPGCGLTRSVISLTHGDPIRAWHFNPVGILIAVVAMLSVPLRAVQLRRMSQGKPELRQPPLSWFGVLCGLALVAQWLYRLKFGAI